MPLVSARIVARIVPDAISGIAFAGPDQSVLCASIVQLQGSIVGDDPANHTFEWEQTAGTPVTLLNANTLTPSFVNPQISDLEFTLYVDRNTPYEDSDTVIISRAPQATMAVGGAIGAQAGVGFAEPLTSSSSSNQSGSDTQLLVINPTVTGWAYQYPPESTYSPIFKADDLARISQNLNGRYWLMNDIDMSGYEWKPLGTPQRPFSGELQGNGFNIDNLTISQTPITKVSSDPNYGSVTFLVTAENSFDGAQSLISDVGDVTFNWENSLGAGSTRGEVRNDQAKFGSLSIWADGATGANFWGWTGPFNVEGGPFDLADQPFTLEAHVYLVTINSSLDILTVWDSQLTRYGFKWSIDSTTRMTMTVSTNGTNIVSFASQQGAISQMSLGQWYHVAITRSATGDVKCWLDGNQIGTTQTGKTQDIFTANTKLGLCCEMRNNSGNMGDTEQYVDNVRITVGVDRYTSNFTAPAAPFSTTLRKPAGLFSHIGNGALIEKVGLTNASISGVDDDLYKGILAGSAQGPSSDDGGAVTVRNVYVEGTIDTLGTSAGGLIGHTGTNVSSIYENTYADVIVTGVEELITIPNANTLSYDSQSTAGNMFAETAAMDVSSDGNYVFVFKNDTGFLYRFPLSTPYDVTTLGSSDQNVDVMNARQPAGGLKFSEDGLTVFYGLTDNISIHQIGSQTLTTPWDISTLTTTAEKFGTYDDVGGFDFSPDGTFVVTSGRAGYLKCYTLSTPFDVSTNTEVNVGAGFLMNGALDYRGVIAQPDGKKFWVQATGTDKTVYQYSMTTAWDESTASYDGISYALNSAENNNVSMRADLTRGELYVGWYADVGINDGFIEKYTFTPGSASTTVGGWAGNFQTEATYNDNFWNSFKTVGGVGTDSDTPLTGELDARTTDQLQAQSNYTNWNFNTIWEIDEGVSPATLQQDITGNIRAIGECDDNWMVIWQSPNAFIGYRSSPPSYVFKGVIVEENVNGAWQNKRFIPKERNGALLTPDITHRISTVWDFHPDTSYHYVSKEEVGLRPTSIVREVTITDARKFTSKNSSPWFGPYGNDAFKMVGGSEGATNNLVINISNPRKITLAVSDNFAIGGAESVMRESSLTIRRLSGVVAGPFSDPTFAMPGGAYGTQPVSSVSITRVSGASIGGG